MPLQPAILVGVGGSGGKVLRTLRQTLLRRLRATGEWHSHELPAAWQMIAIDTITVNSADGYPEELLPGSNYLGLVPSNVAYGAIRDSLMQKVPPENRQEAFGGWLEKEIAIPVQKGAGQNRAVGRAVSAYSLGRMRTRLEQAHKDCRSPNALAELVRVQQLLGADGGHDDTVLPMVISSLAGGTGSGMFLDVVEALATVEPTLGVDAQVVLFGPDIFGPLLTTDAGAGISANTLAAVGSITAGVWGGEPSSGTRALYAMHGLDGAKQGGGLLTTATGSRSNFIIGAVNSNGASIGVMDDAYRAAGESLAAIISDQKVLDDFQNFFRTNVFMTSYKVGDKSDLKIPLPRYTQPFASFGSARLSLGLQRFQEYASQAITRSTVQRLLWPALEKPDPADPRTDETKVKDAYLEMWDHFLANSGLNERDTNDEVVDALASPNLGTLAQTMAATIVSKAGQGAGEKGLNPNQWVSKIQTFLDVSMADFLAAAELERRPKARQWVETQRQAVPRMFTEYSAARGLDVAGSLLTRLREELKWVAVNQLPYEAKDQKHSMASLPGHLTALLTGSGASAIPTGHPILAQVRDLLAKAALLQEGAARYQVAAELILDLEENLLAPLAEGLKQGRTELLQRALADQLDDGRPNIFNKYPRLGEVAGAQFQPGPTELLLIDPSRYAELLRDMARASLEPEQRDQWEEHLISSTVSGTSITGKPVTDVVPFFGFQPGWITKVGEAQGGASTMPTKARVQSVSRPIELLARAVGLLEDQESTLGKYVAQPLSDFLAPADPEERNRRRTDFVAKLVQAFNVGKPLVQENKMLMHELHPQRGDEALPIVSSIPIDPTDELYQQVQSSLTAIGVWDNDLSPKWFDRTTSSEITIFQSSPSGSSAMALSSLMAPVMERWMSLRNDPDARRSFWQMKRARPLIETIPAAPEVLADFVEGWFISGILGQRMIDSPNSNLGFRSQVWHPKSKQRIDFPYPLLGTNGGDKEQLPGVLISLLIAMAECDLKSSLSPLAPYQRLIHLGRFLDAPGDELGDWIREARLSDDAPVPEVRWAGSKEDTLEARRDAVRRGVEKSLDSYEQHFREIEKSQDPFQVTLAWELREPIRRAHEAIQQSIGKVTETGDSLS